MSELVDREETIREGERLSIVHEDCGEVVATIECDFSAITVTVETDHSDCSKEDDDID